MVENHDVAFSGINNDVEPRKWKGPKPQSQNYFSQLSKQFEDIGNT